ncbi:unnamed protein product [Arctogadus glacialis]
MMYLIELFMVIIVLLCTLLTWIIQEKTFEKYRKITNVSQFGENTMTINLKKVQNNRVVCVILPSNVPLRSIWFFELDCFISWTECWKLDQMKFE